MRGDAENRESDRLERLWRATRPPAPSAEAWDRVWTAVNAAVDESAAIGDRPHVPTLVMAKPAPSRARRWAAIGVVLAAQAAAILIAVGIALREEASQPDGVSHTATAVVHIDEGQLVLIRSDADAVQTTDLTAQAGPAGVDAWYLVFNLLESMAGPVVAMSE
ncbi:hypothetical protein [Planctomyces sp. SH-PL62]|uniref:hypothetical protein n=1 Tax=Planctomyces sp. SH-PL62 TaxID=1636152 RepID=UPI00078BD6D4|nr:hypothetical protein [Planctomyces sp. SH-PL62]AMV35966.1 hypothetical protein VT85_00880 [Planctomyces sp. SH-PL62]